MGKPRYSVDGRGSRRPACVATAVRNNIRYHNIQVLESGYGISLRTLVVFAGRQYGDEDVMEAAQHAISVILFKLEGQLIERRPEYQMNDRRMLEKIDYDKGTIIINGRVCART